MTPASREHSCWIRRRGRRICRSAPRGRAAIFDFAPTSSRDVLRSAWHLDCEGLRVAVEPARATRRRTRRPREPPDEPTAIPAAHPRGDQPPRVAQRQRLPRRSTNIVRLIQQRFETDVCSVYLLEPDRVDAGAGGDRRPAPGKRRPRPHAARRRPGRPRRRDSCSRRSSRTPRAIRASSTSARPARTRITPSSACR